MQNYSLRLRHPYIMTRIVLAYDLAGSFISIVLRKQPSNLQSQDFQNSFIG